MSTPTIGLIGGTGFYSFFDSGAREIEIDTPFGTPSAPLSVGHVNGALAAFIPRHGADHRFAPHTIPYRANLWALKSVGVTKILGPCAVGSLRADIGPGTLVVPDQLVDRTSGRTQTFFDSQPVHVGFADPYCPELRRAAASASAEHGGVSGGTMVVVEGPRFSTRAESQWYARQGWSLINMTGHPEAALARELHMCYSPIALVTDRDAGIDEGDGVAEEEVYEVFARGVDVLKKVVLSTVESLAADGRCPCAQGSHSLTRLMQPTVPATS